MRIWDQIDPERLCRAHLLGEHRELHAIFAILTRGSDGYANHPEVKRWQPANYRVALWRRHEALVEEIEARGYMHHSPLPRPGEPAEWVTQWPPPWDDQLAALAAKNCACEV